MNLVFLLEEQSMKELLDSLMPRFFPGVKWIPVVHQGKHDLEKSIPRKLRAWQDPESRFVIVRDQDSADCTVLKTHLTELCNYLDKGNYIVRIPCREMESWFLGDLESVEAAMCVSNLARQQNSRKFREPDRLGTPSNELKKLVPRYQKISGARSIGKHLHLKGNRSHSFNVFISGINKLLTT